MPHSGGTGGDEPDEFSSDPDEPEQTQIVVAVLTEELLGKKVNEDDIDNCAGVLVAALNTRRNVVLENPALIGQLAGTTYAVLSTPQAS